MFIFSNVNDASLHFLFLTFTMPAWVWFLFVLVAGVIIGSVFPWLQKKQKDGQ